MSEETTNNIPSVKEKIKGVPETTGDNVIASSGTNRKGGTKSGKLQPTKDGAIGSSAADRKDKVEDKPVKLKKSEKVAVHSTKNASWSGVGTISKGYNILGPSQAEKWLTKDFVRTATPEEVAREFGL